MFKTADRRLAVNRTIVASYVATTAAKTEDDDCPLLEDDDCPLLGNTDWDIYDSCGYNAPGTVASVAKIANDVADAASHAAAAASVGAQNTDTPNAAEEDVDPIGSLTMDVGSLFHGVEELYALFKRFRDPMSGLQQYDVAVAEIQHIESMMDGIVKNITHIDPTGTFSTDVVDSIKKMAAKRALGVLAGVTIADMTSRLSMLLRETITQLEDVTAARNALITHYEMQAGLNDGKPAMLTPADISKFDTGDIIQCVCNADYVNVLATCENVSATRIRVIINYGVPHTKCGAKITSSQDVSFIFISVEGTHHVYLETLTWTCSADMQIPGRGSGSTRVTLRTEDLVCVVNVNSQSDVTSVWGCYQSKFSQFPEPADVNYTTEVCKLSD